MSDYLSVPKKEYKKLRIDDFFKGLDKSLDESVLSPAAAADTFNFDFSSGALKDGLGIEDMGIDGNFITNIWKFNKYGEDAEEIIMFTKLLGDVFYIKNGVHYLSGIKVEGKVYTCNYRLYGNDVIIMCSDKSPVAVWDGVNAAYQVTDSPLLKSMDIYGDMMFIADADGQTLRYTDDLDPTNWNSVVAGGGYLTMADERGHIGKVVSFLNNLYVFRDYGISKISVSADGVKAAGLYVSSGRIFHDTVVLCGSKIIFLTDSGLYEFDGISTKSILSNLFAAISPSSDARAVYHAGKYYLTARLKVEGDDTIGCESGAYVNNALISIRAEDYSYTLSRGMDIICLSAAVSGVYGVSDGKAVKVTDRAICFDQPLIKRWQSPMTDMGSEKTKVIREVHIESRGDITLTLASEKESKAIAVKGKNMPQKIRLNMRGKKLSFKIESVLPDSYIARPVLVYSEV